VSYSRFVLPFAYVPEPLSSDPTGPAYEPDDLGRHNPAGRRTYLTWETARVLFVRARWLRLRDAEQSWPRRVPVRFRDGFEWEVGISAPWLVLFEWAGTGSAAHRVSHRRDAILPKTWMRGARAAHPSSTTSWSSTSCSGTGGGRFRATRRKATGRCSASSPSHWRGTRTAPSRSVRGWSGSTPGAMPRCSTSRSGWTAGYGAWSRPGRPWAAYPTGRSMPTPAASSGPVRPCRAAVGGWHRRLGCPRPSRGASGTGSGC